MRGRLLAGIALAALIATGAPVSAAPIDPFAVISEAVGLGSSGKLKEAAELIEKTLADPDLDPSVDGRAVLHGVLADTKVELGAPEEAIAIAERGLALLRSEPNPDPVPLAMLSISRAFAFAAGRPADASLAAFREAVAAVDKAPGDPMQWDYVREKAVSVALEAGSVDEAIAFRRHIGALALATGKPDRKVEASFALAALLENAGRFAEATEAFSTHLDLLSQLGRLKLSDRAETLGRLCVSELGASRDADASATALEALRAMNSEPDRHLGMKKLVRLCLAVATDRTSTKGGVTEMPFDADIWRVMRRVAVLEDSGDAEGAARLLIEQATIAKDRRADDPAVAPLLQLTGAFALEIGQASAANSWLTRAGTLAMSDKRFNPAFFALVGAGWLEVEMVRGRMKDAVDLYNLVIRVTGDISADAKPFREVFLPEIEMRRAELDSAIATYKAGVAAYRAGVTETDPVKQANLFVEAVGHFRKLSAADDFAVVSMGLAAETHKRLGKLDDAIAFAREARSRIDRWQKVYFDDDRAGSFVGVAFETLGRLYADLGDTAAATSILQRGLELVPASDEFSRHLRSGFHAALVGYAIAAGDLAAAKSHLDAAIQETDGLTHFNEIHGPRIAFARAKLAFASGRADEAAMIYGELLATYERQGDAEIALYAAAGRDMAVIEARKGDIRAAARKLEARLEDLWRFRTEDAKAELVAGYVLMADIYRDGGLADLRLAAARQAVRHAESRIDEAQRLNRVSSASSARTKSFRRAFEALVAAGWSETGQ